jgi:hypothetical protein
MVVIMIMVYNLLKATPRRISNYVFFSIVLNKVNKIKLRVILHITLC